MFVTAPADVVALAAILGKGELAIGRMSLGEREGRSEGRRE